MPGSEARGYPRVHFLLPSPVYSNPLLLEVDVRVYQFPSVFWWREKDIGHLLGRRREGLEQEGNVTVGLATGHQKMAIVMYMDNSHNTNHASSVGLQTKIK